MADPPADLSDPLVITESRLIGAPAAVIFAVLRDPARHAELDGSGMIVSCDAPPVAAVGDTFVVAMHNDLFDDYQMRNTVVEFVPDRSIAWAPTRHDFDEESWDHRWGWRLAPDGDATEVTGFYDCTRLPEDGRRILHDGEWGRPWLVGSLDRLEVLVGP